jgi:hypothetical protein
MQTMGLKLNGKQQLLDCTDDVNMPGKHTHTIQKNTEALLVTSKQTGPAVNTEKTKYMIMFHDQNACQIYNIKAGNETFEGVYLGTTLTNENSTYKEIKGRSKSGNASYHSVQNLLLSKNIKITRHRTIIFPVVLYGCETLLREERRFENVRE